MSTALRPRKLSSQSQDEEKVEYIEIKKNSEIKKILKAEEEAVKKPEVGETSVGKKEDTERRGKDKKFAFIKDDREREYPKVKEEVRKETSGKNEQDDARRNNTKGGKPAYKLHEEKYPEEKEESGKERRQYRQKNPQEEPQKKAKYIEKEKLEEQPRSSNPKPSKQQQSHHHSKPRSQLQIKKGVEIQVELLQHQQLDQNQIFVQKKSVEQYVNICRSLLKDYEFVAIKAYGNLLSKAFLIAGLLADEFPQLKQINFPRVVKVREIGKQQQKYRTRGFITIQLSLHSLNKKDMGYQDDSTRLVPKAQKKPRNEYQPQKFKEKLIDERELR